MAGKPLKVSLGAILVFAVAVDQGRRFFVAQDAARDFFKVCHFVSQKIYKSPTEIQSWLERCQHEAYDARMDSHTKTLMLRLNHLLAELKVSHLQVYSPREDYENWRGLRTSVGFVAQRVAEQIVITQVLPGGSADLAQLQPGDRILTINQIAARDWQGGDFPEGYYLIQSLKNPQPPRWIFLHKRPFVFFDPPFTIDLGGDLAVFKVSTFIGPFFNPDIWQRVIERLKKHKRLIIDLRGNHGGNFVAMLRTLGLFSCQTKSIGTVERFHKNQPAVVRSLPDDLSDEIQLKVVDHADLIELKPIPHQLCGQWQVLAVLIDGGTASVAEILADALKLQHKVPVLGQPSAGAVLMAAWYQLPFLGPGYTISIPEAMYRNSLGQEIEGVGVWPDQVLFQREQDLLNGEDGIVKQAVDYLRAQANSRPR